MVGPAHADPDNDFEPVGTYQLGYQEGASRGAVAVLNTRSGFVSRCWWDTFGEKPSNRMECYNSSPTDLSRPFDLRRR